MERAIDQAKVIAQGRRITLLAAAKILKAQIKAKRLFGTMPEQYDPAKDENHPSKGWIPS